MATIVLLIVHYFVTTSMPLCGHLDAINCYICVTMGPSIGIVLQLDDHCGATTWPLIKYYQFTTHIKCEFVDLKCYINYI